MKVKELKEIINALSDFGDDELEVKLEIAQDGFVERHNLCVVHWDCGKIYLLGGDHEKDGLWEVGQIIDLNKVRKWRASNSHTNKNKNRG
jgi:hypothetical protein